MNEPEVTHHAILGAVERVVGRLDLISDTLSAVDKRVVAIETKANGREQQFDQIVQNISSQGEKIDKIQSTVDQRQGAIVMARWIAGIAVLTGGLIVSIWSGLWK